MKTWPIPLGALLLLGAVLGWGVGAWSPAWIVAGLFGAFFPNPTRMQIRFLPPIDPEELMLRAGNDPGAAGEWVRKLIQREVQLMASTRWTAWE
jgi:hypothetical protein